MYILLKKYIYIVLIFENILMYNLETLILYYKILICVCVCVCVPVGMCIYPE